MDYHYGQIEAALLEVLPVADDEVGAFRAKLRRLRELGIPNIKKTGSGSRAPYKMDHAIQLVIAMSFISLGVKPRWVKSLVHHACDALKQYESEGEVFIVLYNEGETAAPVIGRENLASFVMKDIINAFAAFNVSYFAREIRSRL